MLLFTQQKTLYILSLPAQYIALHITAGKRFKSKQTVKLNKRGISAPSVF